MIDVVLPFVMAVACLVLSAAQEEELGWPILAFVWFLITAGYSYQYMGTVGIVAFGSMSVVMVVYVIRRAMAAYRGAVSGR